MDSINTPDHKRFVQVPKGILPLGSDALAAYVALLEYADWETGDCYPSKKKLAAMCGFSVTKLHAGLVKLRDAGWIKWEQRHSKESGQASNMYTVHMVKHGLPQETPGTDEQISSTPQATINDEHIYQSNLDFNSNNKSPHSSSAHPAVKPQDVPQEATNMAAFFADQLTQLGVKANPTKKWAQELDRMHRLDGRTWDQIEGSIRFALQDEFWCQNVHSPASLRKQFDKLAMKAQRGARKTTNQQNLELVAQLANQPEGKNPWLLSPSA